MAGPLPRHHARRQDAEQLADGPDSRPRGPGPGLRAGDLRYLTAGGDPGQVEKAKIALKSAAIGYALAVLAPLLVFILASLVGG
ncbi:MAG TPA: pilin [Streptosporangiaceae bacterium]|nr:pilin [Streptosporangiaceae bacterium]